MAVEPRRPRQTPEPGNRKQSGRRMEINDLSSEDHPRNPSLQQPLRPAPRRICRRSSSSFVPSIQLPSLRGRKRGVSPPSSSTSSSSGRIEREEKKGRRELIRAEEVCFTLFPTPAPRGEERESLERTALLSAESFPPHRYRSSSVCGGGERKEGRE
jgi:hypothetical protein